MWGSVAGCYRPHTASAFVQESAQASAGLRLKKAVLEAAQHDKAHLVAGCVLGSGKPLRPGALRLLTEAAAAQGPPPRDSLMCSGGGKNPTFLNMKKGAHVRQHLPFTAEANHHMLVVALTVES